MEVDAGLLRRGLGLTVWRGRCEALRTEPPLIVDGAHNPEAARALAASLKPLLGKRPLGLVLGMCGDKDIAASLKPFAGLVRRCWAVPLRSERSLTAEDVAATARSMGWDARPSSVRDALKEAMAWAAANGGAVCVTGSIFLVGEVLDMHERGEAA
jgi:dihydrofolate synthase/folylpolyglutamate synthase